MKRMLIAIAMMVMPFTASADATSFNEYLAERGIVKENVGGINKTQLTDWDKAWIEFYEIGQRGKEGGVYSGIFWTAAAIEFDGDIVTVPLSDLRNANSDEARIELVVNAVTDSLSNELVDELNAEIDTLQTKIEALESLEIDNAELLKQIETLKSEKSVLQAFYDSVQAADGSHGLTDAQIAVIGDLAADQGAKHVVYGDAGKMIWEWNTSTGALTRIGVTTPNGKVWFNTTFNNAQQQKLYGLMQGSHGTALKSAVRKAIVESYEHGYRDGYQDGYDDGYDDGYNDGYDQGFADGVASVK